MKLMKISKKELVGMAAVGLMIGASAAHADAGPDFTSMIAGVASAGAVAAIVAMGVVKIAPNFAKWATNKVASFF